MSVEELQRRAFNYETTRGSGRAELGAQVASDKRKKVIKIEPLLPESLIISGVSSVFGWESSLSLSLSSSLSVLFLFSFFSFFFFFSFSLFPPWLPFSPL